MVVSNPLNFDEEVLCLGTLFSYSIVYLFLALTYNFICKKEDPFNSGREEENIYSMMIAIFIIISILMPLHIFVRTDSITSDL